MRKKKEIKSIIFNFDKLVESTPQVQKIISGLFLEANNLYCYNLRLESLVKRKNLYCFA